MGGIENIRVFLYHIYTQANEYLDTDATLSLSLFMTTPKDLKLSKQEETEV